MQIHEGFDFFKRRGRKRKRRLDFFLSQCSIGLEDTSKKIGSTIADEFKEFVELKTSI